MTWLLEPEPVIHPHRRCGLQYLRVEIQMIHLPITLEVVSRNENRL